MKFKKKHLLIVVFKAECLEQLIWERLSPQQSASQVTSDFQAKSISKHKLPLSPFLTQATPTEAAFYINTASAAIFPFRLETTENKHSAVCVVNIKQ